MCALVRLNRDDYNFFLIKILEKFHSGNHFFFFFSKGIVSTIPYITIASIDYNNESYIEQLRILTHITIIRNINLLLLLLMSFAV